MTRTSVLTASMLALLVVACPTTPPPAIDAAVDPDAGPSVDAPPDTGPASACDSVRSVTLAATGVTTATGDTTGMASTLARAAGCGGANAAPQELIEIVLPGPATEFTGIRFSLQEAGTAATFDTVVEVREACGEATTAACFDDAGEPRSAGGFAAAGGSTRFLVVSGFNPPTEAGNLFSGPWEMTLEIVPNQHAPVLTGASVLTIGDNVRIGAVGTDVEGDVEGAIVTFLDAAGGVVAIDLDMDTTTPAVEDIYVALDGLTPSTTFDGFGTLIEIALLPAWANVVTARVVAVDSFGLESDPFTATETAGTLVALGGACDATNVCGLGYACVGSTCAIPTAVAAACGAATALVAVAGTPATTIVTVPTGAGLVPYADVDCTDGGPSGEALVNLTVPVGTWDLAVATAGTVTGETDTVVYLETTCGDPATELGCNDDVSGTDYSSLLEVAELTGGAHTLVVELYDGAPVPTMVDVTVRLVEVLAPGAACDPSGVLSRCRTGACPATGTAVCP